MWGVYNGIKRFLPNLRNRPEAAIVNISSLAGLDGLFGYRPYTKSKFAVRGKPNRDNPNWLERIFQYF